MSVIILEARTLQVYFCRYGFRLLFLREAIFFESKELRTKIGEKKYGKIQRAKLKKQVLVLGILLNFISGNNLCFNKG